MTLAPEEWKYHLYLAEVKAQVPRPGKHSIVSSFTLIISESQRKFLLAYSRNKTKPESLQSNVGKMESREDVAVGGVSRLR